MMARLQIDEDEFTTTTIQRATKISSSNQTNTTMEYQIKTILYQVQDLQLTNTHGNQTSHGKESVADAVADVDADPVGETDVGAGDYQLNLIKSNVGLTGTAHTGAKNVHTLPTDTRRI